MKIRKNDNVMVIAGNDKGKTGKVLKVFPKNSRVIVEGINLRKRHTKPTQKNPQGGIQEKEAAINVSNVMILDPKTNEPTKIGSKIILDEKTGKKKITRIGKVSGEMIP
jgi:large subunit ribosomal protein L24